MSLIEDILKVRKKIKVSFHMPAHKYKKDIFNMNIFDIDTTEIDGADNLHSAFYCIKDSENRIANIYGAKKSRLVVSGSSIGLISAIYGLSNQNDTILIGRDSHKSVFNACKIANLSYICAMPDFNENGIPLAYTNFYDLLIQNPNIKLAVLTSPNYYGYVRIFDKIAEELHKRGGYLIVDEAHGAHLEFTELKSFSGISQGADIIVQSAHKTLPAMTMSAILHYGNKIDDDAICSVDNALAMFQSSSPSYPLMISIDSAVSYMNEHRDEIQEKFKIFKSIENEIFRNNLDKLNYKNIIKDPFKIYVDTSNYLCSGFDFYDMLIDAGIYPEFSQYNGVLLYLSIFNTKEELLKVYDLLSSVQKVKTKKNKCIFYPNIGRNIIKARNKDTKYEIIKIEDSLGRISMENIIPYPPGIPVLMKGETINTETLKALLELKDLPVGMIEGIENRLKNIKVERES